jgi:hypothetical protein
VKALLALVIVLAAVAAGPAYARVDNGTGYTLITDTLGGPRHPHHPVQQGYTLITDTLGGNGGPAAVTVRSVPAFDWGDAGIGASAAVGAIFVAFGSTLLVRRRSQVTV